jgi:predicted Zn finger-like uncharacterized protein
MILTCPECATRYFVQDETLGATGRTVRCTNCRASWHATPAAEVAAPAPPPLDLVLDGEAGAVARDPFDLDVEPAAPVTPADLPGEELPKLFRDKVRNRERMKRAATAGAIWGLLAAGFVAVILAAMLFRVDVVKAWPKAASAYAAVGLPVNATGLVIEDERTQQTFSEGRPVLVVSGALRNVWDRPVQPPPLKITLLNDKGKPVKTQIAAAAEVIPPGATRHFAVPLVNPPATGAVVEVHFLLDRKAMKAAKAKQPGLRTASAEHVAAPTGDGNDLKPAHE